MEEDRHKTTQPMSPRMEEEPWLPSRGRHHGHLREHMNFTRPFRIKELRTPNMSSAYTGPEPGGHTKSGSEAIADGLDGMDGPDVMDGLTKLGAGAAGLSGTAGATTTAVAGRVTRPAKGCAASVRQFTACAARVAHPVRASAQQSAL